MNNDINNNNSGTPEFSSAPASTPIDNTPPVNNPIESGTPVADVTPASAPTNNDFSQPVSSPMEQPVAPAAPEAPEVPIAPAPPTSDPALQTVQPGPGPVPPGPMGPGMGPIPGQPAPMAQPGAAQGQPEKKNNKMFIIIVAVLGVAIVAVLILVVSKMFGGEPTPEPSGDTPTTVTPGVDEPSGGTASTTKKDIGGFEFEIPSGYSIQDENDSSVMFANTSKRVLVIVSFLKGYDLEDVKGESTEFVDLLNSKYGADLTVNTPTEKTMGSRNWFVAEGTYQTVQFAAGFANVDGGLVYAELLYESGNQNTAFGDLNTLVDSVTKKTSTFSPGEKDEFKLPDNKVDSSKIQ